MKAEEHEIPAWGYGFGHRTYGECFSDTMSEMKAGVEYIARLEKADPPDDWSDEEKVDFPTDGYKLVLMRGGCPCVICHGCGCSDMIREESCINEEGGICKCR